MMGWKYALLITAGAFLLTAGCKKDSDDEQDCGNGSIDTGEECDGTDFGGQSCDGLGLGGGSLACTSTCTIDVSGCDDAPDCGNDSIEFGEDCDGTDLGGEDCEGLGYDSGTLACDSSCEFDTTGCVGTPAECGDDIINGTEDCDGSELGGADCESLGYGPGTLDCDSDCNYDTSGCGEVAFEYEFLVTDRDGQIQGLEADDWSLTVIPHGITGDWFGSACLADGSGGLMVVGGWYDPTGPAAFYSSNGTTWTDVSPASSVTTEVLNYVAYGGGRWIASGRTWSGFIYSDDNGATWSNSTTADIGGPVAYGTDRFVNGDGHHSTDGDVWTAPTTPPEATTEPIVVFGEGRFVTLGDPYSGYSTHYSDDGGDTWTQADMAMGHSVGFFGATYGDGTFVVGDRFNLVYSEDGATWTNATNPSTEIMIGGLAYHPSAGFVRISGLYYESEIWSSSDGATWALAGAAMTDQWLFNVCSTQ